MNALLSHIKNLYNLKLSYLEKVKKGSLTQNHILTTDDTKYFLKQYIFDNRSKIEEIHMIKKYFVDGGIPIVLPITNVEGNTFFFYENRYYALFPFVSDKQLETGSMNDTATISLGEMLGKIHLLGRDAKLPIKDKFNPWNKEKSLKKIESINKELNKIIEPTDFDLSAIESIKLKKQLIEENTLTYKDLNLSNDHLIHGDYLDHNVFFGDDNKVSYVFDLEKASYSPRMRELFRSMIYSFLSEDFTKESINKAKLYLQSYLKVYPVSKDELSKGLKLYYLQAIHSLWTEREHYLNNNLRADEHLKKDIMRVKYLSQNYDEFENELLK